MTTYTIYETKNGAHKSTRKPLSLVGQGEVFYTKEQAEQYLIDLANRDRFDDDLYDFIDARQELEERRASSIEIIEDPRELDVFEAHTLIKLFNGEEVGYYYFCHEDGKLYYSEIDLSHFDEPADVLDFLKGQSDWMLANETPMAKVHHAKNQLLINEYEQLAKLESNANTHN